MNSCIRKEHDGRALQKPSWNVRLRSGGEYYARSRRSRDRAATVTRSPCEVSHVCVVRAVGERAHPDDPGRRNENGVSPRALFLLREVCPCRETKPKLGERHGACSLSLVISAGLPGSSEE